MFLWTSSAEDAPDESEVLEIEFVEGLPTRLDGVTMSPAALLADLNRLGARHGVGRVDIVENRLVGMKSRGVYETPGGSILHAAHRELESLCIDRDTAHFKEVVATRYAELVYYGQWFHLLRESLQAFIGHTQARVTGSVRLRLYKGNIIVEGRRSPFSLYREDLATFGEEDVYDQGDASGFINVFGLPMKVRALTENPTVSRTRLRAPNFEEFKRD
jgi:argininosuccinate synthase